jgi:hypothetical protein
MAASVALQIISAAAAIGRVATNDYYRARTLAAVAFAGIAGDYAVRSLGGAAAPLLVGMAIFSVLTLRNIAILLGTAA